MHVDREGGGALQGSRAVLRLGTRHIAEGTDHLLFLLVLLLPAPLQFARTASGRPRWGAHGGVRASFVKLLRVVTAFAMGHSLTLLMGSLGWLQLPSAPVETLIAVSILLSAVHAARPLFPGREAWIAGAFGLVHGLAFASALADLRPAFASVTRMTVGEASFKEWGWRVPFLLSFVLLAVSLYIRVSMKESPLFTKMKSEGKASKNPIKESFTNPLNLRYVLIALFGATAGQGVVWYTGQFYALTFLQAALKMDWKTAYILVSIALILATPLFVFFGHISDRIGRKKIILAGCLLGAPARRRPRRARVTRRRGCPTMPTHSRAAGRSRTPSGLSDRGFQGSSSLARRDDDAY